MASVDWSSSFKPESRTRGVNCRRWFWQSSESNRIESNRLVCGTDSNRIVFFFAKSPITSTQHCTSRPRWPAYYSFHCTTLRRLHTMTNLQTQTQKSMPRRWHGLLLCPVDWTKRFKPPVANCFSDTNYPVWSAYWLPLPRPSVSSSLHHSIAASLPRKPSHQNHGVKTMKSRIKKRSLGPVRFWLKTAVSVPESITITTLNIWCL